MDRRDVLKLGGTMSLAFAATPRRALGQGDASGDGPGDGPGRDGSGDRGPAAGSASSAPGAAPGQPPEPPVGEGRPASVRVFTAERLGPLEIGRIGLGQGGLSPDPMWGDRLPEIRALRPRLIRLFMQDYFDLLPAPDRYRFDLLDQSIDLIRRTGATPLLSINFKPRVLFPAIDQDIVHPTDWDAWERLIAAMVAHYVQRGLRGAYWEVGNEVDIGEDGGCPYRFTPENYVPYYARTVRAVLRADPDARVGGPALANCRSPILPAFLRACETDRLPLHFVSWHIYNSRPDRVRETVVFVRELLKGYPSLTPETILNEWNMDLGDPPDDPRIQPCFVLETSYQMRDAGLDYSCQYHIRDYHVSDEVMGRFMSPKGTVFMAGWWNRKAQYDGLFDFQNTVRPQYFAFKLLSRLTGDRLRVETDDPHVHAWAAYDQALDFQNLLFWNFSPSPAAVTVSFPDLTAPRRARRVLLDAETASSDENARLRNTGRLDLKPGATTDVPLGPYGVMFWEIAAGRAG